MKAFILALSALCLATTVVGTTPSLAQARLVAGSACPREMMCDSALGIAIRPASGVNRAPPGKYPRHEIVLQKRVRAIEPEGAIGDLLVGADGRPNKARAASHGMQRLLKSEPAVKAKTRRVVYGGAPGVLATGLRGPGPVTAVILAHQGALYKILAPGSHLAADQQRMLASLHFIPQQGKFPPSNG